MSRNLCASRFFNGVRVAQQAHCTLDPELWGLDLGCDRYVADQLPLGHHLALDLVLLEVDVEWAVEVGHRLLCKAGSRAAA